jgi:hypothetical protein
MPARLLSFATVLLAALSVSPAGAQRIDMPVGYRLTWIGAKWSVGAKVLDASGRPIAASVRYRVADPAIAAVNNRGEVVARKPGSTKVWAIAGKDSASALIIVDQWPARFAFSPASIRLDALGAKQPLKVLASDSAGVPIVGGTSRVGNCRVVNERVASLSAAEITAIANGTTWLRCSDRGLVDSIRVDVQQRAATVSISNKALLRSRTLQVGDTFSVKVSARDRNQKELTDAKPTWASLTPYVFSIDPVSGRARTIGGGNGRILIQLGDLSDSASVAVDGPAYTPVSLAEKTDTSAAKARERISVSPINAFEGDVLPVNVTVVDTAGQQVPLSQIRLTPMDTSMVAILDSGQVRARKSGITSIIVTYKALRDSIQVFIRSRSSSTVKAGDSTAGRTVAAVNFVPVTIPDSTAVYRARHDTAIASIQRNDFSATAERNLVLTGTAIGAFAEHLTRSEKASQPEDRSGPLYGGIATLTAFQKLELLGALRFGTIASVDATSEDLKIAEGEASLGVFPIPSLGVRAGAMLRSETNIARQTWFIPKVSMVARFRFIGDIFNTYTALSLLPKAHYSGLPNESGSLFSRGGEVGLEFNTRVFTGGLTYSTEQLSFDTGTGTSANTRTESFSAIKIRLGVQFGR